MKKLKISFEEENKQKKSKRKYEKYPRLDSALYTFEDEETIEIAQIEHIKKIKARVLKHYFLPTTIVSVLLIAAISCILFRA